MVGIAADGKYLFITEGATPFLFLAARQGPALRTTLIVATPGETAALAAPVRAAVQALDRDIPITGTWTMEHFYAGNAVALSVLLTSVVGGMGVVGLGLAMVGLYGSWPTRSAGGRGDRHPHGHRRRARIGDCHGDAPRPAAGRRRRRSASSRRSGYRGVLGAMFPASPGLDLALYALVVPLLLAVTLVAALVPALRAARIDPLRRSAEGLTMWQDLKHGVRMLRKNPGFSFVAMLSIAIGVGANAAMFSVADTLVLRPLTVPRPNELVTVTTVVPRVRLREPDAVGALVSRLRRRPRPAAAASAAWPASG